MPFAQYSKAQHGTRSPLVLQRALKRFRRRLKSGSDLLLLGGGAALLALAFGFAGGFLAQEGVYTSIGEAFGILASSRENRIIERQIVEREYVPQTTEEERIIETVREASPSVVSIVVTKDVPVLQRFQTGPFSFEVRQEGTQRQELGGGSGFLVSADGLLITNKHVVLDEDADYTVFTKDGDSFSARVLARDPFQDLAVLKVESKSVVDQDGNFTRESFAPLPLGNSEGLKIGQTVVAIGNALGEFRNTVSVGVISGLSRTITASDGGNFVETIENVIQTDAAINRGNSGGPLLNLAGQVIGINTATVVQAQSIGFAIPVNRARRAIEQVEALGKIVYPFLGVQYVAVNKEVQQAKGLEADYGALVTAEEGGVAVLPDSGAEAAGLREGDLILELNGERIDEENSLAELIQEHDPGDTIVLKVLRAGAERILSVTLGEKTS